MTLERFPYSVAWESILGEPHEYKKDDLDIVELLFSDRSELAFFHFSELHQACLGLPGKTFADVLSFTTRSAIDVVDNAGRTSLSWAAQRGDSNAVEKLLKRGANPNRPDNSLRTPLHWSSRQGPRGIRLCSWKRRVETGAGIVQSVDDSGGSFRS